VHQTVLNLEKVRIREAGMMSTLLKPLCGALVIACGAFVLITAAGPLATPALAQAALAQTDPAPLQPQPERPDHPRPRAGDPTTTPAPPPPLSPETRALRSKLDAFTGRDPSQPWSWFVQGTKVITEHDFSVLTGQRRFDEP